MVSPDLDDTAAESFAASGKLAEDVQDSVPKIHFSVDLIIPLEFTPPMTNITFVCSSAKQPWPCLFSFSLGPSVQVLFTIS